jgi:zinc transport system ATP-binding protein
VNKQLYYHNQAEFTVEMLEHMYAAHRETCPVELIAHGMPHRVLKNHEVK